MFIENNEQWLEIFAQEDAEQLNAKINLEQELSDSFSEQLMEQNLNIQLNSNPMEMTMVDPFTPMSHHQVVESIMDIYKFITPYFTLPTTKTLALGNPTNAHKTGFASPGNWNPPNYAHQAIADKTTGKMTAVGHSDQWTSGNADHSETYLEFNTIKMDKDYTTLSLLLNYLFDYRLEYTFNQASANNYSRQQVSLSFTLRELDANGVETGRSGLPINEPLHNYRHDYRRPNGPMQFQSSQKSALHFKRIKIANVKKDHSYRVVFRLAAYTWMVNGRGANEANFVLIPPM